MSDEGTILCTVYLFICVFACSSVRNASCAFEVTCVRIRVCNTFVYERASTRYASVRVCAAEGKKRLQVSPVLC